MNKIWYTYTAVIFIVCCVIATYLYKGDYISIKPTELVFEDFKPLPEPIGKMILTKHLPDILFIKIADGKIGYFYNDRNGKNDHRVNAVLNILMKIMLVQNKIKDNDNKNNVHKRIPDGEYLITLSDAFNNKLPWPIMAFASSRDLVKDTYVVLLPDFEALQEYDKLFYNIDIAEKKYAWQDKKSKIFWRGSATGLECKTPNDCHTRLMFMDYTRDLMYVDAGFVLIEPNYDKEFINIIKSIDKKINFKSFVNPGDSVAYKYLFDIDGNSCTYSRMAWALYSHSVLMKHVSNQVQWYYGKLQPNVHYLPIARDFSNLQDQFEWAEANESEAQVIAENGRRLAKEVFGRRAIADATVEAFIAYDLIAQRRATEG